MEELGLTPMDYRLVKSRVAQLSCSHRARLGTSLSKWHTIYCQHCRGMKRVVEIETMLRWDETRRV